MTIEKIPFEDSVLYISLRSPFARRVRVTLLEHRIPFAVRVFDVFKPNPELIRHNPLARVPTLVLRDGRVLVDSHQILDVFYRNYPDSPLLRLSPDERVTASFWSAMGVGICEKAVEYYLENLRPETQRDPEVLAEMKGCADRVVPLLEEHLGNREFVAGGMLSQADLDVGCGLAYLRLRYSEEWIEKFPRAAAYLARLDARPSFLQTIPPKS